MFHLIFLLLAPTQYGATQAYSDSMYIYNTYAESAKVFDQCTQPGQWKPIQDSLTRVTADAFARLHKYNKEAYAPLDELNKEAVGVAYVFPQPVGFTQPEQKTSDKASATSSGSDKEIAFKVLDEQTHFMVGPNGKGRIPYITMNYYAKGRILIKSEKLNPVTHQPIQVEEASLPTGSN
jgi:hypothetical protein